MKILHCLHNYHPARGGAEELMRRVGERLAARGHEIAVLASNAWSVENYFLPRCGRGLMPPGEEILNGLRVRRVPFSRRGARFLNLMRAVARRLPVPGGPRIRALAWGPRSRAYARAAEEEAGRVDLIVACPLPTLNVGYAWKAARRRRRPLVVVPCFHTEDPSTYDNPLYDRWMRGAEAVIALTEGEKEYLERRPGLRGVNVRVAGVGIDLDPDGAPDGDRTREKYGIPAGDVILFLGQHGLHKGLKDLIAAMEIFWDGGGPACLVIAGNPTSHTPEIEKSASAVSAARGRKIIVIKGFPEEDKRALLREASVFVMVSPFESFGIVFLEAWREGLPVVGCVRGASAKVIEPFADGLLVEAGRPRELAGALLALILDPETRRRMGERGRARVVERYAWENVIMEWEKIYRDAAGAGPASAVSRRR
ncbi:MAG: glycosyltransferase family 4 protein [Acidobacteriota bacterium]|nr:glycosyltransferase family 4 protein [Acidobacteriota bacterium]